MAALLLIAAGFTQAAPDPDDPAVVYRLAIGHLENDRFERFRELADGLRDSPLFPYLEYAELRKRIETVSADRVAEFLARHPDLAVTGALRTDWLRELARREDWPRFMAHFDGGGNVYVRCHLVQAQLATGRRPAAIETARSLWLVGYRQPASCVPAFDLLDRSGVLTPELIRERIRLALEAGHDRLAETLAERMPADQRRIVDHWLTVYRDPAAALALTPEALGSPQTAAAILSMALQRLARRDPERAHGLLPRIRSHYALADSVAAAAARSIALQAAYSNLPDSLDWLWALPPEAATETVHAWRVRGALHRGDWDLVLRAVTAMTESQSHQPRWRYWKARALAALGHHQQARDHFRDMARQFGYYGFLAADELGAPYYWGDAVEPPAPDRQQALRSRETLQRALLLHRAGADRFAYLEWRVTVQGLDQRDRLAAARVALQAEWPWAAMYASALAGIDNASYLRFPRGFFDTVRRSAEITGQPASWLLAMIRQESAFRLSACSVAGACGLMQLMPDTARWMLQRTGGDTATATMLDQPEVNIPIGAAYLDYLQQRFGHSILAVAAYNAGPGNVANWLERDGAPPGTPRWVETLPFGETREYLQAVLFNQVVYRLRIDGHTNRLSELFPAPGTIAMASR